MDARVVLDPALFQSRTSNPRSLTVTMHPDADHSKYPRSLFQTPISRSRRYRVPRYHGILPPFPPIPSRTRSHFPTSYSCVSKATYPSYMDHTLALSIQRARSSDSSSHVGRISPFQNHAYPSLIYVVSRQRPPMTALLAATPRSCPSFLDTTNESGSPWEQSFTRKTQSFRFHIPPTHPSGSPEF